MRVKPLPHLRRFRVRRIARQQAAHGIDDLQAFRKIPRTQVAPAVPLLAHSLAFRFSTP